MRIALLNVINREKSGAMNKDLAGGMGTRSDFGSSFLSRLIGIFKERSIRLPIISFAFLQAILKGQGHEVRYFEGEKVDGEYDLVLIYGSIVDFRHEVEAAKSIKKKYPKAKVGFFGSFPSVKSEVFKEADFVIKGEPESFFLYEFDNLAEKKNLPKAVKVKKIVDLNDLPTPDFEGFPVKEYSYFPAIKEKPFLVLQASRGCPYTCSYYCPYGTIQGPKYRTRKADRLFKDIVSLVRRYGIRGIQFRDPTFGIDRGQVKDLCRFLIDNKVKIKFGIETRLDLLDKEILDLMFRAGLRNLNVGVETSEEDVAQLNQRKLVNFSHQEEIISFCEKLGIKVSAFYIFGLQGDTEESIKKTIDYAVKLNTNIAQFTVSCPYPGTKYFQELKSRELITENDFERFDASNLVFAHQNLTPEQLCSLRDYAFRKYYFRLGYLINFLKWRIREFWL